MACRATLLIMNDVVGSPRLRSATPDSTHPAHSAAHRDRALGLPDKACAHRQRRRAGHSGLGDQVATGHG